jgi:methyl-accepting chemotaxis protein
MNNLPLQVRIMVLAGCALALALVLSIVLLSQISSVGDSYDSLLAHEVAQASGAREMQVSFKKQVQAWKDTLLRGENPEDRDHYGREFSQLDAQVDHQADALAQSVSDPDARSKLDQFISAHKRLDAEYAAGLAEFDKSLDRKPFVTDRMLRGRDRAPTDLLDQVVTALNRQVEQQSAAQKTAVAGRRSATLWAVAPILVILAFFTLHLARGTGSRLSEIVPVIAHFADRDLTPRLTDESADEVGKIASKLNAFASVLEKDLRGVSSGAGRLASATQQLSATTEQQSRIAEQQKDQTSQVATAMQEMSATVGQISESSTRAAEAARNASEMAQQGGKIVEETLSRMREIAETVGSSSRRISSLGQRSDQIGQIVGVIDDIADQTNLLALNAAIEAARAGEQGRGFAVVADEVRKLAERTGKATKEIAVMIRSIQDETRNAVASMESGVNQVQVGVETTTLAGSSLFEIIKSGEKVTEMITQIAAAATQQSAASQQINALVDEIGKVTLESAKGSRQSVAACQELSTLALDLESFVDRFRLSGEAAKPVAAAPVVAKRPVVYTTKTPRAHVRYPDARPAVAKSA